jgi:Cdc6-like AAA superfamily ATPase|tara:strand:+ start:629 stop:1186 length:558 start_codon:yes stop_codon:yes gene_type:complete
MSKRQSLFFIIVGTNGTGKTTLLNNILTETNRDKVLVVEPEGLEWQHYKEINYDQIISFTKGKAKVINPSPEEIEQLMDFNNGTLVLDDCRYYANKRLQTAIRKILIRRRQNAVDIFAVAHGLSEVPPDFLTFCTHIIMFKTNDWLQRLRNSADREQIQVIKQVREKVNADTNPHNFRVISMKDI